MPDGSSTAHLLRPKLATTLGEGYSSALFGKDALVALTVAVVALPLSMAIAVASGVSPARVPTVMAMVERRWRVRARCERCERGKDVDLGLLAAYAEPTSALGTRPSPAASGAAAAPCGSGC
jgi:hypothetical protein